jgi:SAM-dependent methyltransferase
MDASTVAMARTREPAAQPDLKARQRAAWSSGDYAIVGTTLQIVGEELCEALDVRAGQRVLDVAAGNGNVALAAARRWCEVVASDYVPELLESARERAAAERLPIAFQEADAEALPFPDSSFDVVVSTFGVMFTADQEMAASEMARVVKSGGKIGLANWTPEGFIGGLFKTVGAYVPPPPGLTPPPRWGVEDHVRDLLGDGVRDLRMRRREYTWRVTSPHEFVELFRDTYGPTVVAFGGLEPEERDALAAELVELARRFDRNGGNGPVAIPAEYLEVVATRA